MATVAGVDGCPGGWVAVVLDDETGTRLRRAPGLGALLSAEPDVVAWGVDMPIGLLDAGWRRAEVEARRVVGPRRSSVFAVPPRAVVEAASYAQANEICARTTGKKISRQTWALVARIREVDRVVTRHPRGGRVREVHPEVSFATLAGGPLDTPKTTVAGAERRRVLLESAGIVLPREPPEPVAGDAAAGPVRPRPDDVLDAAAVAWSAARIAAGAAGSLPDPPEALPDGRHAAIWF